MPMSHESEVQLVPPMDGVAVVRLLAPERKNALTGDMSRELVSALRQIPDDPSCGAVVITGTVDAFCAGAHRSVLAGASAEPQGDGITASPDLLAVYEIFDVVRELPVPSIAAVCGPAVGAGLNLALACDVRVVGDNAFLRSMFVANQIHPAGGHLRMLSDLLGPQGAIEVACLDDGYSGAKAVQAGLAGYLCPAQEAEQTAIGLARRAGEQPDLMRAIKASVHSLRGAEMESSARHEAREQRRFLALKGG
jgi:enoyl-CoA hydratase